VSEFRGARDDFHLLFGELGLRAPHKPVGLGSASLQFDGLSSEFGFSGILAVLSDSSFDHDSEFSEPQFEEFSEGFRVGSDRH
jgi:hypothetical protein